ncbi:acyl-CoA dehydrogenase [Rugamonas apoptosis]|uniref:Acyl-CoA dehydrogenase n=1 Tax=Rugamonas apoptosis TaxID=2758570 RepID=A0A7W2FBV2_9BURK|nr:acyl-CoA dehydrogenase [Rugamonas apoptosis]MBA5688888.1 acyl-CoA dehydrogenase [Rugamonas apoptosis]
MAIDYAVIRYTLDFYLNDWLEIGRLCERPRFADHGPETFAGVLDLCERLAAERFEPFNRLADTEEPHFDGAHVSLPAATEQACRAYAESGMLAAAQDADIGGMQLPCTVEMAANSFFSAASIGIRAYSMLTVANANLLMAHGSEQQRRVFAHPQFEGRWYGTMNLSEPQAGSSLSDIATRAEPDGAGYESDPLGPRYRINGRKMWISGGEHAMGENIVHLVLAKIPDAEGRLPAGTKGISLFIVPKFKVDAAGRLTGERNDVALAGLNHKLGYRGTVNTLLNYGEGGGAVGYRIGDAGLGLTYMFHMMNEARIQVGLGAAMLGMAGYLESREYAFQRSQGRPIQPGRSAAKNPTQQPVLIEQHPDVRRMLVAQRAYSEGAMALCLLCSRLVDEERTGMGDAALEAKALLEVLTPIAKSWPSEWCVEANSLAIQVLGGYGYTRDFPVEQHWRDNRLNMIHEGTHGIQAMDLLGRKVVMDNGGPFRLLLQRMRGSVAAASELARMQPLADELGRVLLRLEHATARAWASGSAPEALANATAYLRAFGHVVMGWIWLDVARAAVQAESSGRRSSGFVEGKVAAARYFVLHELPLVEAWLRPVEQCDRLWLDLPVEAV